MKQKTLLFLLILTLLAACSTEQVVPQEVTSQPTDVVLQTPALVSIVGDCESSSDWFLKDFSMDERFYDLAPMTAFKKPLITFIHRLGIKSMPLWAAVQPLPDHGLQDDGVHLTFGSSFFNDPEKLDRAWPVRNLTALQVLEAMRLSVQEK